MSAYRYVVFPRGRQPTAAEVRQLESFAGLLANHFAWGVCRNDKRLAMACDLRAFDHARQIDAGFDALISKWEVRGCELADHLGFVKDAAALRPAHDARQAHAAQPVRTGGGSGDALPCDKFLAAKKLIGYEAVAQSLLSVERTLERYATLQRFAAAIPYALIALAAAATIAVGLYVRSRLVNSGREPRQQTIERLAGVPFQESPADEQNP